MNKLTQKFYPISSGLTRGHIVDDMNEIHEVVADLYRDMGHIIPLVSMDDSCLTDNFCQFFADMQGAMRDECAEDFTDTYYEITDTWYKKTLPMLWAVMLEAQGIPHPESIKMVSE
jgi:hypothetical protein